MSLKLGPYPVILLFSLYFMVSLFPVVNAQKFEAKQIKAAYMVNFFKHITWPNEAAKVNFQLVIYKDANYADFLAKVFKNKKIKNKIIVVSYANTFEQLKRADSVYIPAKFNEELHNIASALRGSNTLLISDNSLKNHDVMINLIQGKGSAVISFEVNKSNIIYEKLNMSADLLLLGGTELDIATLYRETERAMQATKAKSIKLKNNVSKQEKQLAISKQALNKLNDELIENTKAAERQKTELLQLKLDVTKKQQQLEQQRLNLEQVSQQSAETENELDKQQVMLAEQSVKNQQILATVAQNKKVLSQQEEELARHKAQLKQQDVDLVQKKQIISSQQTYLVLTTALTSVAILATLLIIFFFNKNKKTTKKLTLTLENLNETQAQLVQSEKMASLGRLVAGVAHELNTPLSIAITANSIVLDDTLIIRDMIAAGSLSKKRMDIHIAKAEQSLTMSEKALERAKHLLVNFKLVAADHIVSEPRKINLAKYINEVMSTLSIEMKKNTISYNFEGAESLQLTTLPGVFSQVLTNLVMNSIIHGFEGMQGGCIDISITITAEQGAVISYKDDGKGMDENTLDNIFEPFFTTKRAIGCTGLGMNIVYNLVNQQLKGKISVKTEQGDGTFVTLFLPASV